MPKPSDYWKKRFEALEDASNGYGIDAFKKIEPAFDQAQRQIQSEIEKWYGRVAANNEIDIVEARKFLSSSELKEFKWDVKEYIKYGRENNLNASWITELENASAKYHISRLEALKLRTQQAAEVAFGNELDAVDGMARKVFTEGYNHTIFEVQKGFNLGWEIGQIDERKLEKIISKPWAADGKHFSNRIWEQKAQLIDEMHNQLTRSVILGKVPDDAIKAISDKFNVSKNQAGRLVMTEQAYFHSVSQKEAFEELDVEEYEIVATLDSHTSAICQDLDGEHFPMKEYQPGSTAPPFHPWCRSVTVPYFEDNYTGKRAARGEDGKTYYVPDNMKYKDWKKSMIDGQTDDLTIIDNNGKIKDKPKFVPAKDMNEVKTRLSNALGIPEDKINLGRMKPELANQYLEGVETFMNDYPILSGYYDSLGTNTGKPNTLGLNTIIGKPYQVGKYSCSVTLDLKSPQDVEKMLKNLEYSIKNGHSFEGESPLSVAIHELVHGMDHATNMKMKGFYNGNVRTTIIDRNDWDRFSASISYDIVTEARQELFGKQFGQDVYDGISYLGRYALTSSEETLAQAVAWEYVNESRPYSAKIKELFDKKVKEVFGS